jgi:purine-binding chemotaxis protein CheW
MSTVALALQPQSPAVPELTDRAGKYLVFSLRSEEFGIEVLKVREIMGLQEITTVPQVPAFVKGVINLRGKVIPVLDLRLKFGLPHEDYTPRTCIIVVRTLQAGEYLMIGMIVDAVVEVLTLTGAEIEDTPEFGPGVTLPYLRGMAKVKEKVKILLDIDQVLSTSELTGMSALLH